MSKCPYPFIYVYEALSGHLGPLLLPLVEGELIFEKFLILNFSTFETYSPPPNYI